MPIHVDGILVSRPFRRRQDFLCICEGSRLDSHRFGCPELIFRYEDALHISILIRQLVWTGLQVLRQNGGTGKKKHCGS